MSPQLIWDNVGSQNEMSASGYLLFADTIIDKSHAHKMEWIQRQ